MAWRIPHRRRTDRRYMGPFQSMPPHSGSPRSDVGGSVGIEPGRACRACKDERRNARQSTRRRWRSPHRSMRTQCRRDRSLRGMTERTRGLRPNRGIASQSDMSPDRMDRRAVRRIRNCTGAPRCNSRGSPWEEIDRNLLPCRYPGLDTCGPTGHPPASTACKRLNPDSPSLNDRNPCRRTPVRAWQTSGSRAAGLQPLW